ncbi:cerato-platanin-related secreted protein [Imleria badia]|nr:cerato-platanin-related secreted protein [Imleria badia]
MRLFAIATVLGLAIPAFPYTDTYILSYESFYDDGPNSLVDVTCAHGEHGLFTHGYTTFNSLYTFPYIGAIPQIQSPDSRYCGSCWELTYTDRYGVSTSLNFTAIQAGDDHRTFTISLEGMDRLTHGRGRMLKNVPITAVRKPASVCGL